MSKWNRLNRKIITCKRCPRLREYCQMVAREKRKMYRDCDYWGKPVPNFGDSRARLLIVGLAPAAHGANRTGRMFTGDRSGDWLYRALYKAGFANQSKSSHRDDGLVLTNCAVTAACHCAPPANKPTREEIRNCADWFDTTVVLLQVKVFLALGQIGWRSVIDKARDAGWYSGPIPKFAHAATVQFDTEQWLVGSYHPSQQNTFTGRLTETMLDHVVQTAATLLQRGAS